MREEFLEMLRNMDKVDLSTSPNYIVMCRLHKALDDKGMSCEDTNLVVGNIRIDVNQEFVDDTELLNQAIETYSNVCVKMKKEMDKLDPRLFAEVQRSGQLTLKYIS